MAKTESLIVLLFNLAIALLGLVICAAAIYAPAAALVPGGAMIGPVAPLLLVLMLVFAWRGNRLAKQMLRLPAEIAMFAVRLIAAPVWRFCLFAADRIPFFASILKSTLDRKIANPATFDDLLASGERERAARMVWQEEKYPHLYREIPEDMKRPLWSDGRLIGGVETSLLADKNYTDEAVDNSARIAVAAAIVAAVSPLVVAVVVGLISVIVVFAKTLIVGAPVVEAWSTIPEDAVRASWTWVITNAASSAAWTFWLTIKAAFAAAVAAPMLALGVALIAFTTSIYAHGNRGGERYAFVTKDALTRFRNRADARAIAENTYACAVRTATEYLKGKPTISLGKATGTLRLRGDLMGPSRGTLISLDAESIYQHVEVYGGTGEGKTTAIIKPLLAQIAGAKIDSSPIADTLRAEKREALWGALLLDGKAVLARDVSPTIAKLGREPLVIGTREGEFGVDIIGSLEPIHISATLRSLARQLGGDGGDAIWGDMAADLIRHAAVLARAYERTEKGIAEQEKTGIRPYSLFSLWAIATNETKMADMIEAVTASILNDDAYFDRNYSTELRATIDYLIGPFRQMAAETKSGVIFNVNALLGSIPGSPDVRDRFCVGSTDRVLTLREPFEGRIVLSALSTLEHGLPARIVNSLLATLLCRNARLREIEKGREYCQARPAWLCVDEAHLLLTIDPQSSGVDIASFASVARSTGVAMLIATQGRSSFIDAFGEEATLSLSQNLRNKIYLRTEDRPTIDAMIALAGDAERARVFDNEERESLDHVLVEDGFDVVENPTLEALPTDTSALRVDGNVMFGQLGRVEQKTRFREADMRFMPVPAVAGDARGRAADANAQLAYQQAAEWRAEDLERDARTKGTSREKLLESEHVRELGRYHAYVHVQRAGMSVQDIIELQHVHN